jgi:precorrin-6B methylase 1
MANSTTSSGRKTSPASSAKKGSLTVVGSGIRGPGQISLEALGWIKSADKILYTVDPVTELWLRKLNPRSEDLTVFYADDKPRAVTYRQMAGRVLKFVRQGLEVCLVSYGHPGVFDTLSHEVIHVARNEGCAARMLPGISAEDCLFADLGVDPGRLGCQSLEATDFLLRKRPLCTSSHVVIWQIGCVGDVGYKMSGFDGRNLGILTETLQRIYGRHYQVILYQAAQFPVCQPSIQSVRLSRITKEHVSWLSTMYVPPKGELPISSKMATRLGLDVAAKKSPSRSRQKRLPVFTPQVVDPDPPANYVATSRRGNLASFISALGCDPRLLAKYMAHPRKTALAYGKLSKYEMKELGSRHPDRIRIAVKNGGKLR